MHLQASRAPAWTAAVFLSFSLVFPGTALLADSRSPAPVADIGKVRINNFGRINPNYYRGAQPKGHDYGDLAALGVKALIDLTSDDAAVDEQAMAERAGLKYFHLPMTTHAAPTGLMVTEFLKIVNDSANQPVYVHCVGGRHRTGVMTAVYRMTQDGWTAERAFQEMKQYKFGADFLHAEFKKFVYSLKDAVASVTAAGS